MARQAHGAIRLGPVASAVAGGLALACIFHPPPPLPEELAEQRAKADAQRSKARAGAAQPAEEGETEGAGAGAFAAGESARVGMSPAEIRAYAKAQGDPEEGDFTLAEALAGLPGAGVLWAELHTGRGVIRCRLHEKETPLTVANFVGLSRGLRPVLAVAKGPAPAEAGGETEGIASDRAPTAQWEKRRYYDGTVFHRVLPGFMIQGGDPLGTGTGNAGYVVVDEVSPELLHDSAGVLSMANRGPGTGSAQFFITLGPTPHLDGKHTVFGKCDDEGVRIADDISMVPRDSSDKPLESEPLVKVEIVRRPPK